MVKPLTLQLSPLRRLTMCAISTIIVVLPLHTYPNKAERRRQSQEPGNPTIDRRHNSKLMHIKQYPRTFCQGLLGVPWLLVGSAQVAASRWYCRCLKVSGRVLRDLCSNPTPRCRSAGKMPNYGSKKISQAGYYAGHLGQEDVPPHKRKTHK